MTQIGPGRDHVTAPSCLRPRRLIRAGRRRRRRRRRRPPGREPALTRTAGRPALRAAVAAAPPHPSGPELPADRPCRGTHPHPRHRAERPRVTPPAAGAAAEERGERADGVRPYGERSLTHSRVYRAGTSTLTYFLSALPPRPAAGIDLQSTGVGGRAQRPTGRQRACQRRAPLPTAPRTAAAAERAGARQRGRPHDPGPTRGSARSCHAAPSRIFLRVPTRL